MYDNKQEPVWSTGLTKDIILKTWSGKYQDPPLPIT